ncbi:exported hypothetical protein [Desulfosarcina cetonica]|uniref:Lcl domain-containing protein n=1 Tax=Desulfosarcina cetonica TaxID=90730 RepID=UPI0006CF5EEA|nr:DUF1566 domain-containing protein [Desulfosarcina cetonica]VTR64405.1 exported hypothetical protein [Desulfosarcina cetonica]
MKSKFFLIAFSFVLMALCPVTTALAQEAAPGDACSTEDVTLMAGGVEASGVGYYMVCQGGVWVRIFETDTNGYLGVGQANPAAPLHVGGEAIIGTTTGLGCSATTEGAIRYNATDNNIEVCDGNAWAQIRASACDNAPAFLAFPTLSAQSTSTLVTSDILQVSGMDSGCTTNVSVSGDGSPEYRTCSDASCSSVLQSWTDENNTLDIQGNYIQLRTTTSASTDTVYTVTLVTGPTSQDWTVSTGLSECGAIGSLCADGTVYAGLTGSDPFYVTRCDAGQTWGGSSCDGARSTYTWNDGATNYTTTSVIDQQDGQTNTASLVTIDSNSSVAGTQPHAAAQYCNDLILHGHSDWYLPAKNELNTMYGNSATIDNFDEGGTYYYWSSSEYSTNYAWRQRFSDGAQSYYGSKNTSYAVRCARR